MKLSWIDTTRGARQGYTLTRGNNTEAAKAGAYGYATIADALWPALLLAGVESSDNDPDLFVGVGLPGAYTDERNYHSLVWHTMIEVDALPPGWVEWLNQVGRVWVPSQWVARTFKQEGVKTQIIVSGYGVDPDVFHPGGRTQPVARQMRFGVWSDALRTRKHPELAVATWLAAELEDAVLEVHLTDTTAAPFWVDGDGRELHHVRVTRGAWSRNRVADWLRSLDVLIYLSGGEGFGLMPFEAMACGVTVICAYNTGMMDYLTDENAILVRRHSTEPAWTYTARWGPNYLPRQLLPDFDEAVAAIQWASDNRHATTLQRGRQAAADIGALTWAAAGERALRLLENHRAVTQ